MTQRYKLLIEYDGTPFCGWQSQKEGCGVQNALATAFENFCGTPTTVFGAGRTDTGVHARGQVGHVTLEKDTTADTLRRAVNQHLKPLPIAILSAEMVADDFDARFSAQCRIYRYRYICRRAPLTLDAGRAFHVAHQLDVAAMNDAAQVFIGKHDFSTFRSVNCQAASPIKNVDEISVTKNPLPRKTENETEIFLDVTARSFLHNQIRSFAGALKFVGEGKWNRADISAALAARDRAACAPVAPPAGLYFMQVNY